MKEEMILKLQGFAEKAGSTHPLILLQILGFDLIFSDRLDWLDVWVDDSLAPIGLAGVIFFNATLKAQPLIYTIAARELVKLLAGYYDDPSFFNRNDNHRTIDKLATEVAEDFVARMDSNENDPTIRMLPGVEMVKQPISR